MKSFGLHLTRFSGRHPSLLMTLVAVPTVMLILLAVLPSLWPATFTWLHGVRVDTDPENMLSADEPVRLFHDAMKQEFSMHDMIVLGAVNNVDREGVFNPESLSRLHELAEFAKTLQWPDPDQPERQAGVIEVDLIAPSTVDSMEPGGPGVVKFEWLMPTPPETAEAALAIRAKAARIPFLQGTLLSENGKAICLYLPITSKDLSYRIAEELRRKTAEFNGDDRFFITGLPVAEDTFGVEMFVQMAISAPAAMLAIFVLMLLFFRKLSLILSPLLVALLSVIWTMGLLVVTGNTIHIMSSMIPIFIMPIAVLDSIHILSLFFDRYQITADRRGTMLSVVETLFMPMLYTSLTSAAGFASLALTPIPPVQIFGLFCAFGIMVAWLLTITFIPAFAAWLPERFLRGFGAGGRTRGTATSMSRALRGVGAFTLRGAKPIVALALLLVVVAGIGITRITINDNPTKWFTRSHPIRIADRVLNRHFGGTYMASLVLEPAPESANVDAYVRGVTSRLQERSAELAPELPEAEATFSQVRDLISRAAAQVDNAEALLSRVGTEAEAALDTATTDAALDAWDEALLFLDLEKQRKETFKRPNVLRTIRQLQEHLARTRDEHGSTLVGKSNSLADIVCTVHRDLLGGAQEQFRIPDRPAAVAQCLLTFQNSHRPQDLWHFVTPDYRRTNLWLQLRSGDNTDMLRVMNSVDAFFATQAMPLPLQYRWFGLTYINVVWQQKMVRGMLFAFLGSFLVVFLMMTVLFRSALWGLLCMLPLTITIGLIYGTIGFIGKDYDMPVAVLSALALGLAVDFAIHFLEHARVARDKVGNWKDAVGPLFGEPARAITRNVIVIAVGFLPLLAAPLVPYRTVGVFLASILAVSGVATLLLLPALVRLLERRLFPETRSCLFFCNCITCTVSAVAFVALLAISVTQFVTVGRTQLTWIVLLLLPVLALGCRLLSRRVKCRETEFGTAPAPDKQGRSES